MEFQNQLEGTSASALSRRFFFRGVIGVIGAASASWAVSSPASASAAGAVAGDSSRRSSVRYSANGWPVLVGENRAGRKVEQEEDLSWAPAWLISGSSANVTLRIGEVATVLLHVAARFHYEIGTLEDGDVVGYLPLGDTRLSAAESNHSSGTAIDIKPGWYPSGARGGFFPQELAVIRDILDECEGVVQWGGDVDRAPAEGHFEIGVPPGDIRLVRVAEKIQGWNQRPGVGAGRR